MSNSVGIDVLSVIPHLTSGPIFSIPFDPPPTNIILFDTGCAVDGHLNCTVACQKPSMVWENATTLQNCLAYPVVSTLLENNGLDSDGTKIAHRFGILPSQRHTSHIITSLNDCAKDYLNNLGKTDRYTSWSELPAADTVNLSYPEITANREYFVPESVSASLF